MNQVSPVSATANPLTLIYSVKNNDEIQYKLYDYMTTSDVGDEEWLSSLKKMFPSNLIEKAKVDYCDDFYQKQIKEYFNNSLN